MGVEGRDQTGRAVNTRPGAWEAGPQGRAGRQQGPHARWPCLAQPGHRGVAGGRSTATGDGWMGRKLGAGRRPAGMGTRSAPWGKKNSLPQRGAVHRKDGPGGELCSLLLAAAATECVRHTRTLIPTHPQTQVPLMEVLLSEHGSTDTDPQVHTDPYPFTHKYKSRHIAHTHTHIISYPPICVHVHTIDTHSSMLVPTAAHVQGTHTRTLL